MTAFLDRLGGYFPALLATALPVVFIPAAGDSYVLPRTAIVIAGAFLGLGLVFLTSRTDSLGALDWPMLAAGAAVLLALAFSISWPLSVAGSYARYESAPVRWSYLLLLAATALLARERRHREWLVAGFVFGTCVACLWGVQQWATHVSFRPDGNLGNANLLAALVAMAFPLAIQRTLRRDAFLFAWAAAVVVLVAGWWVTTSRSGAFGMLAGGLTLVVFSTRGRLVIAAAVASLSVVGVGMAALLASPLRVLNNDPPELRIHLWADGLRMVAARPLTGWGEDTTGLAFGHFLSQDYASLVTFDRIHSGPLDIAATQGLIGLVALGWVLLALARAAWRRRFESDVAALAAALAGYTVWVIFNFDWAPVTGVFWILTGTLWASVEPPADTSRRPGALSKLAAIGLVVAAVVIGVLPVLADVWYLRGRSDLAVRVDPLQAQYHWAIGTLPELQRAADLGETTPDMYVQLGDAYLHAGNRAAARSAYLRALEIDPYFSPASQRLAALGSNA
ncbi:MAG TPA: O-antigen ligase family protein [Candidatus Dormibacteraeota bacterium]|nr:O-antigen ligase family protein [Candidatus Dormibacteraeota bacterium]